MKIGHITIGERPLKIAEVGLNHCGERPRAIQMIRVAKECGADVVKFQTFRAHEFCKPDDSLYPVFKKCELPYYAWPDIAAECRRRGIMFMSTPQNVSDLEILLPLGIPAIKIGADDARNLPLVKEYASHGLPLIISMGMCNEHAWVDLMEHAGDSIFLLCTSQYPCPPEEARLSRFLHYIDPPELRGPNYIDQYGFSDHTIGTDAAVMAVAYGAVVFEKHFTLDHNLEGPDHAWACEPDELAEWCTAIDNAWVLRGDSSLDLTPAEEEQRRKYQRRPGELLRGE